MKIDKTNVQKIILTDTTGVKPDNKSQNTEHKQISELSNICYKPSFGRSWSEHKSWGAVIDPKTKEVSFKIFTYPDTKKVEVVVYKKNDRFNKKVYELTNKGNGVFETDKKIPKEEVSNGDRYSYVIYKGNGDVDTVKDPYSNRQKKLLGESVIYDHSLYNWSDDDWYKSNPKRISRLANSQNNLSPVKSARIYEFNTATLTKKGTFDSAKSKLDEIAQMGFNAIELMPVENTYSFNWGYDGVDKMAPSEHLGGPDELKSLIDYAHSKGLNVIMDMVPNHVGPDGSSLLKTGPYLGQPNNFGDSFNYEGKDSRYVRDFMVNAALNWIDNYHCDGLRLDMTKFMGSDYTMKQIAAEINYHKPDAFLIAEDSRSSISVDDNGNYWENYDEPHDKRVINPLRDYESAIGASEQTHINAIENISNNNTSLARLGFDSEWDFNFFHTLNESLYQVIDLDKLEKACYCAQDRVKYIMSHDEIGNHEGTRLLAKLMVPMLHLNENMIDKANANRDAQFAAEKLAIMLQTGELDKYDTSNIQSKRWINAVDQAFKDEVLKPLGIKPDCAITYNWVKTMYNDSFERNKMAMARVFSIPGQKMVFQGDEAADLTPFRFFREFESVRNEKSLHLEKGYNTGRPAFMESKLGSIQYSTKAKDRISKFKNLVKDLNILNIKCPSLYKGTLIPENTVKHEYSQVFATHSRDNESGDETFTITNFKNLNYPSDRAGRYYIKFPKGVWKEVLNTDSKRYEGSGLYTNNKAVFSDGENNSPIKLANESTIIFKRVG